MKTLVRIALVLGAVAVGAGCANQASFQGKNPYVVGGERDLPAVASAHLALETARELDNGGFLAEAAVQYERARQFDPAIPGVARRLAVIYDDLDRYNRARDEYKIALAEEPDDAALMNDYGYFNYANGNLEQSEIWLRRAVDQDPFLDVAWVNLGVVLAEQQRYKESLKAFQQVLPSADAHYNLAVCLVRQQRYDEGREALGEALRLDESLGEARDLLQQMDAQGM